MQFDFILFLSKSPVEFLSNDNKLGNNSPPPPSNCRWLNPYYRPGKKGLTSLITERETEAQRAEVTCARPPS